MRHGPVPLSAAIRQSCGRSHARRSIRRSGPAAHRAFADRRSGRMARPGVELPAVLASNAIGLHRLRHSRPADSCGVGPAGRSQGACRSALHRVRRSICVPGRLSARVEALDPDTVLSSPRIEAHRVGAVAGAAEAAPVPPSRAKGRAVAVAPTASMIHRKARLGRPMANFASACHRMTKGRTT